MKQHLCVVGLASVVAVAPILGAQSGDSNQSSQPVSYVAVTTVTAKPDAIPAFEDYVKKVIAGAGKIGLKSRIDGYQGLQGTSPFVYNFVTGHATLAGLDTMPPVPALVLKAYGDTEGRKILDEGRGTITAVDTYLLQYHNDISINPRPPGDAKYVQGIEVTVKPESAADMMTFAAKVKEAAAKASGAPTVLQHTTMFGPGATQLIVLPFDSWAERTKWPTVESVLTQAFGEAEANRLLGMRQRAVSSMNQWVVVHRPDLSYVPGTSSD